MPGGGEILAAASLSHIGHHSVATNKLCYRRYPLSTENSSEREIGVSTNRTSGLSVPVSDAYVSVGPDLTRYRGLFALAAAVTESPVGGGGEEEGPHTKREDFWRYPQYVVTFTRHWRTELH